MQSDRNSYFGVVFLDSFNKASRDKDNILDQMYKKQICSDFYYQNLNFVFTKMHNYIGVALKLNFMSSLF